MHKLHWINGEIPRKFSYREIFIEGMKMIIIPTKTIIANLENDSYLFSLFDNDTLKIKNLNGNEKIIYIPKKEETNLKYHKVTIIKINGSKDIEMGGSFTINNFTLDKFNCNFTQRGE